MKKKKLIQAGSVASLTLLATLAASSDAKANEVTPVEPATTATPTETPVVPATETVETAEIVAPAVAPITPVTLVENVETAVATNFAPKEETASAETPATPATTETITSKNSKEVVILHTNDIHGRLEEELNRDKTATSIVGVAKLDTVVKEERSKENQSTYLLDAGDAFQGLPISNASKGEDMANIMNKIGYDAMTVGNHEFDFSLDTAKKYKEILKFPILSANTYANDVRLFEAHTILDKDTSVVGDELVVIGVTTPETATKTHPRNVEGVTFKDPITEVENVIKELASKATPKNYVILAHLGNDASTLEAWRGSTLAKTLSTNPLLKDKNVVVIDGHSHTVENAKFGNVSYTQTGSYLNNIGKVSFTAGSTTSNIALIPAKDVTNLTPNTEISTLVKAAKENFEKVNSEVVVENNPVELSAARENVRVRETNLGNLISDALYTYGNKGGFDQPTDLAVFNGGGIRADIKKDTKVTKADIIKVLPFGNSVAQIEVTGQTIKDMFGVALASATQTNKETGEVVKDENGQPLLEALGGFLHISGAKVYYDTNLEKDARILKIEILDQTTGTYKELDLNKTYRLATNDFLAAGGDGYKMLGGARKEGPSADEALAQFIKTVKLEDYAVVNPNSRLISISTEEFNKIANAVTKVPQVAPTVETKPELTFPTAKGESVKVELPAELDAIASDLLNLTANKPELNIVTNKDSAAQVKSDTLKPELTNTGIVPSTTVKTTPVKTEGKVTKAASKQKAKENANTLPKTSATTSNSALPAGLAAALLAAGLLTANRRKED